MGKRIVKTFDDACLQNTDILLNNETITWNDILTEVSHDEELVETANAIRAYKECLEQEQTHVTKVYANEKTVVNNAANSLETNLNATILSLTAKVNQAAGYLESGKEYQSFLDHKEDLSVSNLLMDGITEEEKKKIYKLNLLSKGLSEKELDNLINNYHYSYEELCLEFNALDDKGKKIHTKTDLKCLKYLAQGDYDKAFAVDSDELSSDMALFVADFAERIMTNDIGNQTDDIVDMPELQKFYQAMMTSKTVKYKESNNYRNMLSITAAYKTMMEGNCAIVANAEGYNANDPEWQEFTNKHEHIESLYTLAMCANYANSLDNGYVKFNRPDEEVYKDYGIDLKKLKYNTKAKTFTFDTIKLSGAQGKGGKPIIYPYLKDGKKEYQHQSTDIFDNDSEKIIQEYEDFKKDLKIEKENLIIGFVKNLVIAGISVTQPELALGISLVAGVVLNEGDKQKEQELKIITTTGKKTYKNAVKGMDGRTKKGKIIKIKGTKAVYTGCQVLEDLYSLKNSLDKLDQKEAEEGLKIINNLFGHRSAKYCYSYNDDGDAISTVLDEGNYDLATHYVLGQMSKNGLNELYGEETKEKINDFLGEPKLFNTKEHPCSSKTKKIVEDMINGKYDYSKIGTEKSGKYSLEEYSEAQKVVNAAIKHEYPNRKDFKSKLDDKIDEVAGVKDN